MAFSSSARRSAINDWISSGNNFVGEENSGKRLYCTVAADAL